MVVISPVLDSLREAFFMFWETLWALVLGFGLSGVVQAFVSRGRMERTLGRRSPAVLAKATFFGMVSSSCSYAASAMAKSLFQKGADFSAAMVFMIASTNLVVELGIVLALLIGWQFTASEFAGGFLMIMLLALISRVAFPEDVVEAARRRLQGGHGGHDHRAMSGVAEAEQEALEQLPLRSRLRSLAAWSDAAAYTMADITMLRREMVIGYGIAGFLAVLVPNAVWGALFMSGHGFWTSLENAVVGPLIAIISFVCSIGNVPLAAALWKGGISFGGVISFIFADLIAFPLLAIYRKYYGWGLMLRILGSFWLVMATGGLAVEYVFSWLGLVPTGRPAEIAPASFSLNYTLVLNVLFLAVFAGLYYLYRNRSRFGGGAGYALDPVCGMQVETATAPAHVRHGGHDIYFCSDRCRERFQRDPQRFTGPQPTGDTTMETATFIDPVCGMSVEPDSAAARRDHDGRTFYFCATGCATRFDADPARYAAGSEPEPMAGSAAAALIDPVCGMSVDPATAAAMRRHDGRNYFFCSDGCAATFDADPAAHTSAARG